MIRNVSHFLLVPAFLMLFFVSNLLGYKPDVPGPIQAPDSSLPEEIRLLSGKWKGNWDAPHGWDCALYVENVSRYSARVTHVWGEYTTKKGSCHCDPSARTFVDASVSYVKGRATIAFTTPSYNARNPNRAKRFYSFSFTVKTDSPQIMQGEFISGKESRLRIVMRKEG